MVLKSGPVFFSDQLLHWLFFSYDFLQAYLWYLWYLSLAFRKVYNSVQNRWKDNTNSKMTKSIITIRELELRQSKQSEIRQHFYEKGRARHVCRFCILSKKYWISVYSSLPDKREVSNKCPGWKISVNLINVISL